MMKSTLCAFAVTTLLAGTATAQELSGEITLAAYSGVFQDGYIKSVIEPFEKAHPGVKVNYFGERASSGMLGLLRAQATDPQLDVVIFDVSTALIGNKEGLLAPIPVADVPNIADLAPQAIIEEGYGPAVTFDNFVVVYNPAMINPAPTSIEVLWEPQYKDKLAITSMPSVLGTALMFSTSAMLDEDYTKSVDKSVEKLAELAPAVQTFDPKPDAYTLVMNGAVDLATGWNARTQYYADQSGGKIAAMTPKEGALLQVNTINLVKGAKNPTLAKAFIDYALSPEAQSAFAAEMYYSPTNSKATPSKEVMDRTVFANLDNTLPVDWAWAATQNERWNTIWKRRIIAAGN